MQFSACHGGSMNLILIAVLLALMALAYQIGLKKSKAVAGANQNSATLHSRPGHGSTFRFVVPMAAQGVSKVPDSLITNDLF